MPESYQTLPEEESIFGSGNFGWVDRVRQLSDNKIVACKSIRFQGTDDVKKLAERECAILRRLSHDNAIRQLNVRWLPNQVRIYMDYCQHGSLQDSINQMQRSGTKLSESYVWHIAFQIAAAILYCHHGLRWNSNGSLVPDRTKPGPWNAVLHRDIKPANVFLASQAQSDLRAIRLGDFGLGQVLQESGPPSTYVGTHQYMPPEISRSSGSNIIWTTQCDVFSFGCIVYSLCTLKPPFPWPMESPDQMYDPLSDYYSADLVLFISSCLAFCPEMRPDALRLFYQAQHQVIPSQGSSSSTSSSVTVGPSHNLSPNVRRSLDLNLQQYTRREKDVKTLASVGFRIDGPHFDADAALLWAAREGLSQSRNYYWKQERILTPARTRRERPRCIKRHLWANRI